MKFIQVPGQVQKQPQTRAVLAPFGVDSDRTMNRRVGNEVRLGWKTATMTGSWDLEDANINVV